MICTNCKEKSKGRAWRGTVSIFGIEVEGTGEQCSHCDEVQISADECQEQERLAAKTATARGISTACEFKFVRKMAKLTAADLADLLDVTVKTVSRWETGEIEIPRTARYVVADLYEQPRASRRRMEQLAT